MIHFKTLHNSFAHAWRGIRIAFRTEQSFRVQALVGALVILASAFLDISTAKLVVILLLVAAVLVLELMNSTLERIVDAFKPRVHPIVRDIKDLMAAAVLTASVMSALIGTVILLPEILALF